MFNISIVQNPKGDVSHTEIMRCKWNFLPRIGEYIKVDNYLFLVREIVYQIPDGNGSFDSVPVVILGDFIRK